MTDCFFKYNATNVKTNANKTKVTNSTQKGCSCYGSIVSGMVSSKTTTWRFEIIAREKSGKPMAIGISELPNAESKFYNKKGSYSYLSNGCAYNDGNKLKNFGPRYGEGDIVIMTFDGTTSTLSFCVGQKCQEIKIQNASTHRKYRMSVWLSSMNDSLALLPFESNKNITNVNQNSGGLNDQQTGFLQDAKDDEADVSSDNDEELSMVLEMSAREYQQSQNAQNKECDVQSKLASLESKYNILLQEKNEFEAANHRQRARIVSLQKENESLRNDRDSTSSHIQSVKQENLALKSELEQMRSVDMDKRQRIESLTSQINKLLDDEKEYKLTIKQLEDENTELKLKCIDESKYETWNAQEVVLWIVSLDNNRMSRYKETLLRHLKEEEIEGSHLCHITVDDLMRWDIKNFMDKKFLLQKIKELTGGRDVNRNEGVSTAYI